MEWHNRQRGKGSTVIEKLHLRRSLLAPYHHEYIVLFTRGGPIYRVDRRPDPNTPFDTIMRTGCKTYDTIQSVESRILEELEQTSDCVVELHWQGEQSIDLLFILSICFALKQDEKAKQYTLQRYNCYFLSWAIVMIAARDTAAWETRLDAVLSNLVPYPGDEVIALDLNNPDVEHQELLKRAREQALERALEGLQQRKRAMRTWQWSWVIVLWLLVGMALTVVLLVVTMHSAVVGFWVMGVVGIGGVVMLLMASLRGGTLALAWLALAVVLVVAVVVVAVVRWERSRGAPLPAMLFVVAVAATILLVRVPQQARQQEQQLAQQRLEQLRQGGQPEEKELAAELAAELARELSRERDLQKALLSTQQGREKVWEKVMNIAREAVGDMRGLKSYMSDSDLEWAAPRQKEQARTEAIDVVREAVDTALGLVFCVSEDNNNGLRTGFILSVKLQHLYQTLREAMQQSANPMSKMLSPTELDIWQSTIVQTIQSMLFAMWYVQ